MLLHQLFHLFDSTLSPKGVPDIELRGICEDSRLIKPGELFIARPGAKTAASQYINDAAQRGAVAVVTPELVQDCPLPQILISDPAAASRLAHLFHNSPSKTVRVVGITGTNGKTTTAYIIRHLLKQIKQRCGMIGTVEIDDGDSTREATMTTPGAVDVAELIKTMRDAGCRGCAMEVSSHALDQSRVAGVEFAGAAFTNLTGDHLDYHLTMDRYADAKARLFEMLSEDAVAVVNAEDNWSDRMIEKCRARVIRFGFGESADYRARDIAITSEGSHFILHTPDGHTEIRMGLIGRHNIQNALTAAALAGEVYGFSVHQIAAGLRDAQGAPGRLQAVRAGQPFAVLVDYAHTDDALENVLTALRPLTRNRLRVLFGCGGDRDRTKRPRMARTASKLSDAVYVTSDNPRTENADSIIDQIVAGFGQGGAPIIVEPDRRAAIQRILGDAGPGDVVLLAGKGHENYQIVGQTKHHFDDVEEATKFLTGRAAHA
jgi:UDP-N-acetylmuramoyl-L-alanyl-D-glutamate--2,6-diaminopimelate ligase